MQAEMLKDYLSKYSTFKTQVFNSGEKCLESMDQKPEIIFLDYYFDQAGKDAMNGIEILKELKSKYPESEVVMFSGQDKIEVAVNTIKYGAFDYIVKNESAFHRTENVIFNIIKRMKLEGQASLYKKLAIAFAVGFVIVLAVIIVLYLKGAITENPGWM